MGEVGEGGGGGGEETRWQRGRARNHDAPATGLTGSPNDGAKHRSTNNVPWRRARALDMASRAEGGAQGEPPSDPTVTGRSGSRARRGASILGPDFSDGCPTPARRIRHGQLPHALPRAQRHRRARGARYSLTCLSPVRVGGRRNVAAPAGGGGGAANAQRQSNYGTRNRQ